MCDCKIVLFTRGNRKWFECNQYRISRFKYIREDRIIGNVLSAFEWIKKEMTINTDCHYQTVRHIDRITVSYATVNNKTRTQWWTVDRELIHYGRRQLQILIIYLLHLRQANLTCRKFRAYVINVLVNLYSAKYYRHAGLASYKTDYIFYKWN